MSNEKSAESKALVVEFSLTYFEADMILFLIENADPSVLSDKTKKELYSRLEASVDEAQLYEPFLTEFDFPEEEQPKKRPSYLKLVK